MEVAGPKRNKHDPAGYVGSSTSVLSPPLLQPPRGLWDTVTNSARAVVGLFLCCSVTPILSSVLDESGLKYGGMFLVNKRGLQNVRYLGCCSRCASPAWSLHVDGVLASLTARRGLFGRSGYGGFVNRIERFPCSQPPLRSSDGS